MNQAFKGFLVGFGLLGCVAQAQASVLTTNLNESAVSALNQQVGVVTVTDYSGTDILTGYTGNFVKVDVTLGANFNFVDTGGPHTPFAFNLSTAAAGHSLPSNGDWIWQGSSTANPFGTYTNGLGLTTGQGQGDSVHGPLDFWVDGVTAINFLQLSTGPKDGSGVAFFAADIVCTSNACNGTTGTVAGDNDTFRITPSLTEAVPEPSTWAMLILGFAGVGFMAYRRKSKPVLMAV
jgi:hypothetical protein